MDHLWIGQKCDLRAKLAGPPTRRTKPSRKWTPTRSTTFATVVCQETANQKYKDGRQGGKTERASDRQTKGANVDAQVRIGEWQSCQLSCQLYLTDLKQEMSVSSGPGRIQVHLRARPHGVDAAQQQPHHAGHQGKFPHFVDLKGSNFVCRFKWTGRFLRRRSTTWQTRTRTPFSSSTSWGTRGSRKGRRRGWGKIKFPEVLKNLKIVDNFLEN